MTAERHLRFWLIGLTVFLVAVFLLRSVLLPFVAGMAVAYLLDPVCDRLEARKLSRTVATTLVTLAFVFVSIIAFLLVLPALVTQIARLVKRVPVYIEKMTALIGRLLELIETQVDSAMASKVQGALSGSSDQVISWVTGALTSVVSGGVAFVNLMSLLIITPVVAFYLLRDWDDLVERIDGWLPRKHAPVIRELAKQVDETLAGFLRGQGLVCLLLGVFYAIGLTLAGLDFGLIVGLVAGALSFIPFVGSIIGMVLSVGLAIFQFDSWIWIAVVAAVFFLGQILEGNFLTPKLVGERVGLHPVWVIFGLLAGGTLFGFVGVLLAVPVTAIIGVGVRFALGRYLASPYYLGGESAAAEEGAGEPES